ncbi:MAG: GNAT family N-acetyltransferase [Devosia sp.]|nr:GNAT family N-acetyltransferase [Devosia sp.]
MGYELRPVTTPQEWQAMHDIRRAALFTEEAHPGVIYDENHPLDRHPGHQPFLLMLDDRPIGVVRLDDRGNGEGIVRLVAVRPELQGRGHGRELDRLVEVEARGRGMRRLMLNARNEAIGFYQRTGWRPEVWDATELAGIASACVQMVKSI